MVSETHIIIVLICTVHASHHKENAYMFSLHLLDCWSTFATISSASNVANNKLFWASDSFFYRKLGQNKSISLALLSSNSESMIPGCKDLPYHSLEAQWGCSPIQWGLSRWPVLVHRMRMGFLYQGWRWTWATYTRWRHTFLGGSSWCVHTDSLCAEGGTPWNPQVT